MSIADTLEIAPHLSFRGVSYRLMPRTLEMEGAVEVRLQGLARDMIVAQREHMTPLEYESQLAGWRREGPSAYAWDMPACQQFVQSPRGLRTLAWLQLAEEGKPPGTRVSERLVSDWFADPVAGPEIFAAVVESNFPLLSSLLKAEAMRQANRDSLSTGTSSVPDSPPNGN